MRRLVALVALSVIAGCGNSSDTTGNTNGAVVCAGDVYIASNAERDAFAARGCAAVTGWLTIEATEVTGVDLPGPTSVGGMNVRNVNALASLSLPSLTTVGGHVEIGPAVALTTLSLPARTTVGFSLYIDHNSVLPRCLAIAFKDDLVAHGFTNQWTISNDDTTATCP